LFFSDELFKREAKLVVKSPCIVGGKAR